MKIDMFADYDTLCAGVADEVEAQLRRKPGSVLVFPTGNTPLGLFRTLVGRHRSGRIAFDRAHVVLLDEYAGITADDPRSLAGWLDRELLTPINIDKSRVHGVAAAPDAMDGRIKALGGLDLVILGLGPNGHLGFNEPGSAFDSRTRRIDLTPDSIVSNAGYWGSEARVPRQGITLGLATLSSARSVILMVSGVAKRGILSKVLTAPISPEIPATVLRTWHQARIFSDVEPDV